MRGAGAREGVGDQLQGVASLAPAPKGAQPLPQQLPEPLARPGVLGAGQQVEREVHAGDPQGRAMGSPSTAAQGVLLVALAQVGVAWRTPWSSGAGTPCSAGSARSSKTSPAC